MVEDFASCLISFIILVSHIVKCKTSNATHKMHHFNIIKPEYVKNPSCIVAIQRDRKDANMAHVVASLYNMGNGFFSQFRKL